MLVKSDFDALRVLLLRTELKGSEVNSFIALLNKLALHEASLSEDQKEPVNDSVN